jgi:endo-1,4-beta-mannosidase
MPLKKLSKEVFDSLDKGSLIKITDTYSKYSNTFKIVKYSTYICIYTEPTIIHLQPHPIVPIYNKTKKKKNGLSSKEKNRLLSIFHMSVNEPTIIYEKKEADELDAAGV